jgi:DNA mismatch endonuclease (patch repair protein)
MVDTVSKSERSRIMRSVKGRGNASTELKVVRLLREHHITGWRRHLPLAGKPDFAFPKARVALFIDGCFWHGCPAHLRMPASNVEYWRAKVARNMARDARVTRELEARGWRVLRVWEHEIKEPSRMLRELSRMING